MLALISGTAALCLHAAHGAEEAGSGEPLEETVAADPTAGAVETAPEPPMYIREYRVQGARNLPRIAVEEAVYPYLGPGRTSEDVEQARAALEKAYHDKGFQTVAVEIPVQQVRRGIVRLQVVEATVGRLRVKGSRYFLLSAIKDRARSMAEGKVVNFNQVEKDILALNQLSDRTITPEIRPGLEPGTVDIDLNVKDTFPLHGSIELNNRYSADTTPLRLNASLSYNNLWQLGHSLGMSYQVAPEAPDEVEIFSGYYSARLPHVDWLSLTIQGTKSNSNVNTLAAQSVVGRGETLGFRAIITLPPGNDFYQSFNFGLDYKRTTQLTIPRQVVDSFEEKTGADLSSAAFPEQDATYYPLVLAYSGTWSKKGVLTEVNLGLTLGLRGAGGGRQEFDNFRFKADRNFLALRGDLSHTRDLPYGFEVSGLIQGQLADQPLINTEQFAAGGLGTVRGYLEATALGDNAALASLEFRSPSLLGGLKKEGNEWRIYTFIEGAVLTLHEALPEQIDRFELASYGFGSSLHLFNFLNASVDVGIPIIDQNNAGIFEEPRNVAGKPLITFRVWAEF